jgi:hypothetical protein
MNTKSVYMLYYAVLCFMLCHVMLFYVCCFLLYGSCRIQYGVKEFLPMQLQ